MALILCPECGKQFSDRAAACPNCGCPTSAITGAASSQSSGAAQMLSLVDQTLEELRKAETDYHIDAARAENFVNRTKVDLNSSSAHRTLSEIVDRTETAASTFFERIQALIPILDGGCRPLLATDPGAKAIIAVAGTIKLINEKSRITKDYAVSFNGTDLGKATRSSYSPPQSSLAIQGFWESALAGQPNRTEAERFWSDKRAEYDRAMGNKTKAQYTAEGEKADILNWMEPDTLYTSGDIADGVPSLAEANCTRLRASGLLTQLVNDGKLETVREGRQTYYSIVTGTPEEREEKRRRKEEARRQQQEREKAERERKEREAAERKKQEEKKKKEQQAAYDKAMAQWEAQKSKAEADRTREWARRLAQLERGEKTAVETEYEARKKAAERDLKRLQKQEKQAQEALDVLGAFQVSEKQEQKKLLRSARAGAEQAKRELEAAEKAHLDALAAFSERLEKKKANLTQELDRKYPVPKQPDRGDYFPEEREQAEKRRKEEERKAEAERKRKEQAAKEEAQRREEAQKREAANRKESIRKTIAIILTVVGSIVFVIGLINGCQGGRDTSGWLPVIIGGFFAAWIGIKLLNGSI